MAHKMQTTPLVTAHDASYVKPGYRSFEFASFEAREGEVVALFGSTRAGARDLLLAVAGAVRPTAGVLTVCGVELADAEAGEGLRTRAGGVLRALRRPHLARGMVGVGAVSGLAAPEELLTVEEVVARELGRGGRGVRAGRAGQVFDYLGRFQLATRVGQRVGALPPLDRARLSAALAFACGPQVACIDAGDPFCAGMSAEQVVCFVRELSALAVAEEVAVLVAVAEPAAAAAVDTAVALDVDAAEALEELGVLPRALTMGFTLVDDREAVA